MQRSILFNSTDYLLGVRFKSNSGPIPWVTSPESRSSPFCLRKRKRCVKTARDGKVPLNMYISPPNPLSARKGGEYFFLLQNFLYNFSSQIKANASVILCRGSDSNISLQTAPRIRTQIATNVKKQSLLGENLNYSLCIFSIFQKNWERFSNCLHRWNSRSDFLGYSASNEYISRN